MLSCDLAGGTKGKSYLCLPTGLIIFCFSCSPNALTKHCKMAEDNSDERRLILNCLTCIAEILSGLCGETQRRKTCYTVDWNFLVSL